MKGIFNSRMVGAALALSLAGALIIPAMPVMAAVPAQGANLTLVTDNASPNPGDTFHVTMMIGAASGIQIAGPQAGLSWTPGFFNCTAAAFAKTDPNYVFAPAEAASATVYFGSPAANNAAGTVSAPGVITNDGSTANGPNEWKLFTYTFVATNYGSSTINVTGAVIGGPSGAISPVETVPVTITVGTPDLTITQAQEVWTPSGQTSTYNVNFTAKNQGVVAAPAFDWKVTADGVQVATGTHSAGLAVGATADVVASGITLTGGGDVVVVTLDPANAIAESNENNNSITNNFGLLGMTVTAPATVASGANFQAVVSATTNSASRGAQSGLTFNPAVAKVLSVDYGLATNMFKDYGAMPIGAFIFNNTAGTVNPTGIMCTSGYPAGATGTGTLFTVTFQAIAGGSTAIAPVNAIIGDIDGNTMPGVALNAATVTVTAAQAIDLVITQKSEVISYGGNPAVPQATISYTVTNQGNKNQANPTKTGFYFNGVKMGEAQCPKLNAAQSYSGTAGPFNLPLGASTIVTVTADIEGFEAESNENNNSMNNTLVTAIPDLVVTEKHETVTRPGYYKVYFTIKNIGTGDAGASFVSITQDSTVLAPTYAIVGLAAGASVTGNSNEIAMTGAFDQIIVTADCTNVVSEWNETNNTRGNTAADKQSASSTVLTGAPEAVIILTVPTNVDDFKLKVGDNAVSGILNVKANTNYVVAVSDNDPATFGRMTKWNGLAYDTSVQLHDPMVVNNDGSTVTLPGPGQLITGSVANQVLNNGQDFGVNFNQKVYFSDAVTVYRIAVSFTASITF